MVGRHHGLNRHEFEQAPGDGEGQGSLACCSPCGRKESDTTEWLNWTWTYCIAQGTLLNVMWQLGWERSLGENGLLLLFSVISFGLFILFMGFSRQKYWSGLLFHSPVDHILSELSTMTCLSWVALHSMAHSFIELDKAVIHVIRLVSFLWFCFSILNTAVCTCPKSRGICILSRKKDNQK